MAAKVMHECFNDDLWGWARAPALVSLGARAPQPHLARMRPSDGALGPAVYVLELLFARRHAHSSN